MASLGSDLSVLRKDKDLSFEDVQQITKLPLHIIKSIEDDSIFKKINQETTYVRNYVRTYAKAVGIEETAIIAALNQIEDGDYTGGLLKRDNRTFQNEKANETEQKINKKEEDVEEHSPEYSAQEPEPKSNMTAGAVSSRQFSSIDWRQFNHKTSQKKSIFSSWIIILLVAILAVGAFLLYNYFSDTSSTNQIKASPNAELAPVVPDDTLQQALLPGQKTSSVAWANRHLSDTLTVAVVAATGKLEPVHIYSDLGLKRPFWLELHDTMYVNFTDTVQIWAVGQFKRMELMLNGRPLENAFERFYNSESERIVLSRAIFEADPD